MTATTTPTSTKRWDTSRYMRMVDVRYGDGRLVVDFADGTHASVDAARLVSTLPEAVRWDALRFDPYEILVPTDADDVEIPWLAIRTLTDPEFAAHLEGAFAEETRAVGRRIGELRRGQGLDRAALATRAGISAATLARIERGEDGVGLTTLRLVLAAMGHGMDDLATEPILDPRP